VLLALRIGVRHLHVQVEGADVVTQRDEVLARDLLHLLELGARVLLLALALTPAAQRDRRDRQAQEQQQEDREASAPAVTGPLASAGAAATRARLADPLDEVGQHGEGPVAGARLERLAREVARGDIHTDRARAERVADDTGVGARLAELLRDLAQRGAGVAARLVARRLR
jgi:hypothetical protein